MIIAFAWTTPALLAGAKTMTRRDWTFGHARKFHADDVVDAWDQTPRVRGASQVATIRLTCDPYRTTAGFLSRDDYVREGFEWLAAHGHQPTVERVMANWAMHPREVWVVEFQLIGPVVAGRADLRVVD